MFIIIPARPNAPETKLFIQIVASDEASLKTKPYVFILPGGPGFNHSHYKDYAGLSDAANVVFFDPRGCGLSDKGDPATYTMDNYIQDVDAIRQHLKLSKIMLVGKSFGAMCALGYALQYPTHLSKLILAAGVPSYKFLDTAKTNFLARQPTAEQSKLCQKLWDGSFDNDEELGQFMAAMVSFYSYKKRQGEPVNRPAPDYPASSQPLNQGFGKFLRTFNYADRLHEVQCATLILVGDEDWITDKKYSQQMAARIPRSRLIIFPKSDHSMESDVPELFFGAIRNFIRLQPKPVMFARACNQVTQETNTPTAKL